MSKPDSLDRDDDDDRDDDQEREDHIRGGVIPYSEDVPDDAVHVDLTDDPESQDWLAEGRRDERRGDERKSVFEMDDDELEERTEQTKRKIEQLEEDDDGDDSD